MKELEQWRKDIIAECEAMTERAFDLSTPMSEKDYSEFLKRLVGICEKQQRLETENEKSPFTDEEENAATEDAKKWINGLVASTDHELLQGHLHEMSYSEALASDFAIKLLAIRHNASLYPKDAQLEKTAKAASTVLASVAAIRAIGKHIANQNDKTI